MLERQATSLIGSSLTICTDLCSKHNFTDDIDDDNHTCVLQEYKIAVDIKCITNCCYTT